MSHYHERPPKVRKKRSKARNRELGDLDDDVRFDDPEHVIYINVTDGSDFEGGASTAKNIAPTAPNMATPVPNTERDVSPASSDISEPDGTEEEGEDDEKEVDHEDAIQSGTDALLAIGVLHVA